MADRNSDRLELILSSVGQHLVVEAADDVGFERPETARWGRRLLVAATVAAMASAAVASIAPARRVVSGWLRAGDIEIEIDPDLTVGRQLPSFIDGAEPLEPSRLAGDVGTRVPDVSTSRLGAPGAWWSPLEGGVLATWHADDTSLWIVESADTLPGMLEKWLRHAEAGTTVPDLGDGGYVVEGRHIFQTPFRTVAANSVVAWSDGDLTFRFDSTMPSDELLDVARSIAAE